MESSGIQRDLLAQPRRSARARYWLRACGALLTASALTACSTMEFELRRATTIDLPPQVAADEHVAAGAEHFEETRYGLAIERFQAALRLSPLSPDALNGLAASYDMIGRYDVAQQYYRRALMQSPDDPRILNNLGYSALLQHKFARAERYLSMALGLGRNEEQRPVIVGNLRLAKGLVTRTRPAAPEGMVVGYGPQRDIPAQTGVRLMHGTSHMYRLVSEPPSADAAPSQRSASRRGQPPLLEISNGAGRRGMAARLARYISRNGTPVQRLTNADSFAYRVTVVSYQPGFRWQAEAVAALIPVDVELKADETLTAEVCVRLGGDALAFDRKLIATEGRGDLITAS